MSSTNRTQITVALIGVIGVVIAALITNYDKIFDSSSSSDPMENYEPPRHENQQSSPPLEQTPPPTQSRPQQQTTTPPPQQQSTTTKPQNKPAAAPTLKTIELTYMASESGWVTDRGRIGAGDYAPQAGDFNNNESVRGFMSFDISTLDPSMGVNEVILDLGKSEVNGDLFPDFGSLKFESIQYGKSLPSSAYNQAGIATILDTYGAPDQQVPVTQHLINAIYSGQSRFQVRFKTSLDTDNDGQGEIFWVPSHIKEPRLIVSYYSN